MNEAHERSLTNSKRKDDRLNRRCSMNCQRKFSPEIAALLLQKINSNVDALLCHSKIPGPNWKSNDATLGLFHRDEIRLGNHLGSGAFSDVYEIDGLCSHSEYESQVSLCQSLARDVLKRSTRNADGNVRFAVNFLRTQLQADPTKFCRAASDLILEAQVLATLSHPNILAIHGWSPTGSDGFAGGSNDGYFLIVDRLCETLDQRMKRWRSEGISDSELYAECARIESQVASGLEYLHNHNNIFRDLKPCNIDFDENDQVRIFDFGLCRELPGSGTSTSQFRMTGRVGTLRYKAEECVLPKDNGTYRYGLGADVYSFGMVLYEMVSRGNKPFSGYTREQHEDFACRQANGLQCLSPGYY